LHVIEDHIEEWRARMSAREVELQAHREMLLVEAAERERLLAQAASDKIDRERSLEEGAKEHRVAFHRAPRGAPSSKAPGWCSSNPRGGYS
jgi:hypothetical protein